VAIDGDRVYIGEAGQIEIFDRQGQKEDTWLDGERMGLVTAIACLPDGLLVADTQQRCIHHYDRSRSWRNDIGEQHRKGGFHIPNGILDFALDAEGIVHVANPGMHRVERYRADGEYLDHFGRFHNRDPAGFPGCCNPTNIALDPQGRIYVTEKAGPRVKVYERSGELLAVIAEDSSFDAGCKNMDLAVSANGQVFVADTVRFEIQIFTAVESPALVGAEVGS